MLNSRTIKFAMFMAFVTYINGSLALFSDMISKELYVLVTLGVGSLQAVGAVWLRYKTTEPMSSKQKQ